MPLPCPHRATGSAGAPTRRAQAHVLAAANAMLCAMAVVLAVPSQAIAQDTPRSTPTPQAEEGVPEAPQDILGATPAPDEPAPETPEPTSEGPKGATAVAPEASAPGLTKRPTLLASEPPRYPPEAWDQDIEGDVVLLLWVDEAGLVEAAEVVSTPGYGMETAALVAAKALRFTPAELDGEPVKLKIRYTFRFRKPEKGIEALAAQPPVAAPSAIDDRPKGRLHGTVYQRGTGKPLVGAEVYVLDLDEATLTDTDGAFVREVAPGGYALTVNVPGHYPFESLERVESGDDVEVVYYVEQKRHERYKTIVWGSEGKAVVGRTTLADAEIYEVPGTMGDPMRVVMLMPGVTSSVTGIGYPVVHGVLPGDTRYEVDGVQVPMLYHLMAGSAVVNPRFTGGIAFQPGGYSVQHGQFPGALIEASGVGEPDERVTAADVSLIQASLFHAQPITDDTYIVAAGRWGTLGLIIEAIASDVVFRYWDYQTKLGWKLSPRDRIEVIAFGAGNEVGEDPPDAEESVLELGFHRLAVRWRRSFQRGWFELTAELGQEGFVFPPEDTSEVKPGEPPPNDSGQAPADYRYAAVRAKASATLWSDIELHAGADLDLQDFGFTPSDDGTIFVPDDGLTVGAYLEAEWSPGPWTVVPGVRVDHYRYGLDGGPRETAVDPRLAVGVEATEWLTVKASAGAYHGPPRVTLVSEPIVIGPVPGMGGVGLDHGLSRSIQTLAGLEFLLPYRLEASVTGYYSWLHTALDFSYMDNVLGVECVDGVCNNNAPPPESDGRSYGLELLLRRRLGESVFGWITYSLSRSERDVEGFRTMPFVFDQTHVFNTVVSWEVGRHWTLGATFHIHSGRPYTPTSPAYCPADFPPFDCPGELFSKRLPSFWRIDARVQKREVFDTWYFDFYIDIMNLTFNKEVIGYERDESGDSRAVEFPIIIPMLGLKGQF